MHVITSHNNIDFDGLAAMVAIKKLYPDATMVFSGRPSGIVKSFLSLYRDVWDIKHSGFVDCAQVRKLTVVDTQLAKRLGRLERCIDFRGVEVVVVDHHPHTDQSLPAEIHEVGAITTTIVEELLSKNIEINVPEATLFALGIYSDTAFFTSSSTTCLDLFVAARLVELGADLKIVNEFLHSPLSLRQRDLLEDLLTSSEEIEIHETNIVICTHNIESYVDGLGLLVEKMLRLGHCDVVVAVVVMDDRTFVTVRSGTSRLDAGKVCYELGGGGHAGAASATIKEVDVESVKKSVLSILSANIRPQMTASQIMSKPVRVVSPMTTIKEAHKIMLSSGHSGLPVVHNSKLVGIISRRDVDKAEHHGLAHAPVKGFMSDRVITSGPETSISELQRLIVANNIGRIPILDSEDNIVGIVTRTDLLYQLHGTSYPHWYKLNYSSCENSTCQDDVIELMNESLSERTQGILMLVGQTASRCNTRAYLVGGMVRDLLLGNQSHDLDIVVEGQLMEFCSKLVQILHGKVTYFEKFGTARIGLESGVKIDCAQARTEFYAGPGALPEVHEASISHDLFRRDFTVNTLAIALTGSEYGQLLDCFGGCNDLRLGLIRILYNLSFVEDPTRILRAVRFEQRYGFRIETETLKFLHTALDNNVLREVSGDKLLGELKLCLKERKAARVLLRMDELGILKKIFPGINLSDRQIAATKRCNDVLAWINYSKLPLFDSWIIYLAVFAMERGKFHVHHIADRLSLPKNRVAQLENILHSEERIRQSLCDGGMPSNSTIYELLESETVEALLFTLIVNEDKVVYSSILRYLFSIQSLSLDMNGHDLTEMGLQPGPLYARLLSEVKKARLDGQVSNRQEELEYIEKLLMGRKVL